MKTGIANLPLHCQADYASNSPGIWAREFCGKNAVNKAKVGRMEKLKALKRLKHEK